MAVDDPAVTYQAFRDLIVAHLLQKGWKRLLGKRIRYEQSLFEHSLNTLDVVLTYLSIFRQAWHPPLTRDEEVALIVTAMAHDAGKATDDFQRYIRGESGWVGHWSPELTQGLVGELYRLWARCSGRDVTADERRAHEAVAGVRYTIRQERTPALEASELLRTDHLSPRWRLFMDVVDDVDNLVSCPGVLDTARFLGRGQSLTRRCLWLAKQDEAQLLKEVSFADHLGAGYIEQATTAGDFVVRGDRSDRGWNSATLPTNYRCSLGDPGGIRRPHARRLWRIPDRYSGADSVPRSHGYLWFPRLDVFSPADTGGHDIDIARIAPRAPAKQDSSAAR